MPSQPPDPYNRNFNFTEFSQTQPNAQIPGNQIDIELNDARQSINQTINRLAEIQSDDGSLLIPITHPLYQDLLNYVTQATAAATAADSSADSAAASANDAEISANVAGTSELEASAHAATAQGHANTSASMASDANDSASDANTSKLSAQASAEDAAISAASALNYYMDIQDYGFDASKVVSGVIDIARIPVIPSQVQVVSSQASIENLTQGEQDSITGVGVLLTLTDGTRWVYGGGSKVSQSSYIKVADITPDWTEIENKPSLFAPESHLHNWSEIEDKPTFGTAAAEDVGAFSPAFDQGLDTTDDVEFNSLKTDSIGVKSLNSNLNITVYNDNGQGTYYTSHFDAFTGGLVLDSNSNGITFPDATVQTTAYTGQNSFESLTVTDGSSFVAEINGAQLTLTNGTQTMSIDDGGILFPDSTSQTTAAQFFNQSLNKSDQVEFNEVTVKDLYETIVISPGQITFPDGTGQSTRGISSANAAATYYPLTNPSGYSTLTGNQTFSGVNTFTNTLQISGNVSTLGANQFSIATGGTAVPLTIQNNGTGNSFVVNDQNADPTPFVINSAGLVGLNVSNPAAMLDIAHSLTSGTGIRLAVASGQSFTSQAGLLFVNIQNTGATGKAFVIENRGTGDCLYIHDQAATDTTPFVVNNAGDCIIGGQTITDGFKLDVRGAIKSDSITVGAGSSLESVTISNNTVSSGGSGSSIHASNYPHELEFVVGGVTYRVPARAL